jgi:hypothetical protein
MTDAEYEETSSHPESLRLERDLLKAAATGDAAATEAVLPLFLAAPRPDWVHLKYPGSGIFVGGAAASHFEVIRAALKVAAVGGHAEAAAACLRRIPSLSRNAVAELLQCAAASGHAELTRLFLADSRMDAESRTSAFCSAVREGQLEVVRMLTEGFWPKLDWQVTSALDHCIDRDDAEMIRLVLAHPGLTLDDLGRALRLASYHHRAGAACALLEDHRTNPINFFRPEPLYGPTRWAMPSREVWEKYGGRLQDEPRVQAALAARVVAMGLKSVSDIEAKAWRTHITS